MVEFAIAAPIVIFLLIVLIDISRYLLARNLVKQAAEKITDEAKISEKIVSPVYNPVTLVNGVGPDAVAFGQKRDEIIVDGLQVPLAGFLFSSNLPGATLQLSSYDVFDPATTLTIKRDALLLMPGQSAVRKQGGDTSVSPPAGVFHPTCIDCDDYRNMEDPYAFQRLMAQHGIYAQASASLPLIMLFGRQIIVVGESLAWAELDPRNTDGELYDTSDLAESCDLIGELPACAAKNCDPVNEVCEFDGKRYSPDCATCRPKTCDEYWTAHYDDTGETFCDVKNCQGGARGPRALLDIPGMNMLAMIEGLSSGGSSSRALPPGGPQGDLFQPGGVDGPANPSWGECRFFPDLLLTNIAGVLNCGSCFSQVVCQDLHNQNDACLDMGCEHNEVCNFLEHNDPDDGCVECAPARCIDWTTEAEAVADNGFNAGYSCMAGERLYFMPYKVGATIPSQCLECGIESCDPDGHYQGDTGCQGGVFSGPPNCVCCMPPFDCPPPEGDGREWLYDARVCACVLEPSDSTGT